MADPTPGPSRIGAQAGSDVDDGPTARQQTDEHIQHLAHGRVIDNLQGQAQVGEDGGEKVRPHETVSQDASGGKGGRFWHIHHLNLGAHGTAPRSHAVPCILPHGGRMLAYM